MSLLGIVQAAQSLIGGMATTTMVVGNTDPQVRQLLVMAANAGLDMVDAHPWTRLTKTQTHIATATEMQTGFLPFDFSRFIDQTIWNTSRRLRVNGPLTPQEYSQMKAMASAPSLLTFTLRGGKAWFYPVPAADEVITYDYISRAHVISNLGAEQVSWQADTDTGLIGSQENNIEERLYWLHIVWSWLSRKGLDFSTELSQYQLALSRAIAADGGRRTIDASATPSSYVQPPGTPEGTWALS